MSAGFLINAGKEKRHVVYHFGVEVFHILRVEDGHEGLCAHGLAAVFLSHHQCDVLWVVLKVVDERLALASDGLGDKHTRLSLTETAAHRQNRLTELGAAVKAATSDEAEC